jgi:L-amino acid N-acyltransferase YncA/aromatic ring-cleaving dioxygenase
MSSGEFLIRPSREDDIAAITAIYGHHVLHGVASFEDAPPAADELARRRREILAAGLPYLVAESSRRVLGYCYASHYRTRSAYRYTLEDSIYVDAGELGRGIGRALLSTLIERSTELGYRQMIAVIGGSDQWPSIRLHEALGFTHAGCLAAVGFKFGGWVDTVFMQRALGPGARSLPAEVGLRNEEVSMREGTLDTAAISGYHAHLYYDAATKPIAERLRRAIAERFSSARIGNWHDEPVGPHPVSMYQVAFAVEQFTRIVPWLMLNREGLNVLVHPQTNDSVADHTRFAAWLGAPLPLHIEVLHRGPR